MSETNDYPTDEPEPEDKNPFNLDQMPDNVSDHHFSQCDDPARSIFYSYHQK